jgi:Ca-activated chloride channel family protein
MMLRMIIVCLVFWGAPARTCETALLLAIDVSNSIDAGEYKIQTEGLAAALRDPEIAEILVRDRVAISVLQWSGADRQTVSIPWQRMTSAAVVSAFSMQAHRMPRAFILSNTAPAEALTASLKQFQNVSDCKRKIIDISGDGTPNAKETGPVGVVRRQAEQMGVTINAVAIEALGLAITNFYRRRVITRDGFVLTARGVRDYPRAIREKLLREISRVMM